MTCPEVREQLSAYLDGQLPDGAAFVVRRHLDDCSVCQQEAATLKSISQLLRLWEESNPPPSLIAETRAKVYQRMRQSRPRWTPLRGWTLAGAAACVLLGVWLWIQGNTGNKGEHGEHRSKRKPLVTRQAPPQPTPAATRRPPIPTIHPASNSNLQFAIRNSQFAIATRPTASAQRLPPLLQEPAPLPPSLRAEESFYAKSLLVACSDPARLPMYAAIVAARQGELQRKVTDADEGQDARLDAKVTLHVRGRPLGEVLEGLSKQTNVTLEADKSVQEQKVVLLLKDLPLREVMTQLQKLFDFDWVREKGADGQWKYVLTRSVRSQALAEAARHSVIARAYQLAEERLKEIVQAIETNDLERAERIGLPDFSEALRKKVNGIYAKAGQNLPRNEEEASANPNDERRDAKAVWLLLTKDAIPALLNGRGWQTHFTDLTPEQRVYFFLSAWGMRTVWNSPKDYDVRIELEGVEQAQPRLKVSITSPWEGVFPYLPLEVPPQSATRSDLARLVERLRKADAQYRDAALRVSLMLPSRPLSLLDIEEAIREQTGLAVMGDFYYAYSVTSPEPYPLLTPPSPLTLAELLAFLEQAQVDWVFDKSANLLRLKHRLWMFASQFEPPPKIVDDFKALVEKKKGWDLEDLAPLTNLPENQLGGFGAAVGYLANPTVYAGRDFLHLYGQLSPELRQKCWSEEGLAPQDISDPEARIEFYNLILKFRRKWAVRPQLSDIEEVRFRIVRRIYPGDAQAVRSADRAALADLYSRGGAPVVMTEGDYVEFLKDGAKEFDRLFFLLEFRKGDSFQPFAWIISLPPKGLYPKAEKP